MASIFNKIDKGFKFSKKHRMDHFIEFLCLIVICEVLSTLLMCLFWI